MYNVTDKATGAIYSSHDTILEALEQILTYRMQDKRTKRIIMYLIKKVEA